MKLCHTWFLLCFFLLCACEPSDDYTDKMKGNKFGASPLYIDPADTGNSLFETITLGVTPNENKAGTLKITHNTDLDFYLHKGIFMHNPDTSYFLNVLGAKSIDMNDSVFKITSTIGDAHFKIVNNFVIPVDFNFNYNGKPTNIPGEIKWIIWNTTHSHDLYFICPPAPPKIVYGWEAGNIKDPKCYTYN